VAKKKQKPQIIDIELQRLEQIKKLVVLAMFSDDELMDRFVLKGGNALDLVLRVSTRASLDIDLSMENDFGKDMHSIRLRLEQMLDGTFRPEKYVVFDVTLEERPEVVTPELAQFWGGYRLEFKLISPDAFARCAHDPDAMRRNAMRIGGFSKFQVDISKFEYCGRKRPELFEGYRIFVYTPEMMVGEKLRAICQQMPEYSSIVKRTRPGAARGRDFVDIHALVDHFKIDMGNQPNSELLRLIFAAKRVPMRLLGEIHAYREFHRPDFQIVKDTVKPGVQLRDFDFYFDFVLSLCKRLEPLWHV